MSVFDDHPLALAASILKSLRKRVAALHLATGALDRDIAVMQVFAEQMLREEVAKRRHTDKRDTVTVFRRRTKD
jgi:hypothetical protein